MDVEALISLGLTANGEALRTGLRILRRGWDDQITVAAGTWSGGLSAPSSSRLSGRATCPSRVTSTCAAGRTGWTRSGAWLWGVALGRMAERGGLSDEEFEGVLSRVSDDARFQGARALLHDHEREGAVMNYEELGDLLAEADWGALSRDEPERPRNRRRPPAPTPASEERQRLEERDRARSRVARIADLRETDAPDELARTLGLPLPVVREASDQLTLGRELRPELIHALGAPGRPRLPRSEVVEALGGEDCYELICEEFAADALGRVAPPDRGSDVRPLTRTGEETDSAGQPVERLLPAGEVAGRVGGGLLHGRRCA